MLNHLKPMRQPDAGEIVGLPFVDVVIAAFQSGANAVTNSVGTLPAAAGATDLPPALVVPAAAVPGDAVVHVVCLTGGGLDAGLGFAGAQVTLAGGPGVGQITIRTVNPTGGAIPGAPAARTFRCYILR